MMNYGYLWLVQIRYHDEISQTQKRYACWVQTFILYIHGMTCNKQRHSWYMSKNGYVPGVLSVVYAKTQKLISGVRNEFRRWRPCDFVTVTFCRVWKKVQVLPVPGGGVGPSKLPRASRCCRSLVWPLRVQNKIKAFNSIRAFLSDKYLESFQLEGPLKYPTIQIVRLRSSRCRLKCQCRLGFESW